MQRKSDKIIVFYGLVAFQTEKRNIVFSHQLLHIGVRHKHTFAPYVGHGVIHHVVEYLSDDIRGVNIVLPDVIGKTEAEAAELLSAKSITYRTVGNGSVVTDQLPSAGKEVPGHSEIVLYMGEEKVTEKTTVPNFIGYGVADVNWLANQYGLYIQAKGTDRTDVYVSAAYQDIPEGTEVDKGTTITVEFTTGGASD